MGLFSSIGKFFKKVVGGVKKVVSKVVKFAKKVAPIALGAAAAFFTGGAALGGATMSWGGAVATGLQKLGISGTLGNVLASGITYAGKGALAGALTAGVTGGSISKGALGGALLGGAIGAGGNALGMIGAPTVPGAAPPAPGGFGSGYGSGYGAGPTVPNYAPPPSQAAGMAGAGPIAAPTATEAAITGVAQPAVAAPATGVGGFLERNASWLGPVAQTVGSGILNYASAREAASSGRPMVTDVPLIEDIRSRQSPLLQNVGA